MTLFLPMELKIPAVFLPMVPFEYYKRRLGIRNKMYHITNSNIILTSAVCPYCISSQLQFIAMQYVAVDS